MDFERFDLASRGPLGSMALLLRARMWKGIGALGAALTVGALAVEPFLQQIPTYPSHQTVSGNASIPTSLCYVDHPKDLSQSSSMMSLPMKGAVYTGIFASHKANKAVVTPSCPTGNCTWPEYSSLGVCSECKDLISVTKLVDGFEWHLPYPFGNALVANGVMTSYYIGPATDGGDTSYAFKPLQNHSIVDVVSVYWPPGPQTDVPNNPHAKLYQTDKALATPPSAAYECILYFCVKTYSAQMQNGNFRESTVGSWPGPHEKLPSSAWHISSSQRNDTGKGNMTLKPPNQDATFTVDLLTLNLIRKWAKKVFASRINATKGNVIFPLPDYGYGGEDVGQAFFDDQTRTLGPRHRVYNSSIPTTAGPKPLMDRIAASMTTYMREMGGSNLDTTVTGEVHSVETIVQVRWYWAIFPVAIVALTFAFTISTIILSMVKAVPIWKSSGLASILYGLDPISSHTLAGAGRRLEIVEESAEDYLMRMKKESGRWMLQGSIR